MSSKTSTTATSNSSGRNRAEPTTRPAEIVREYGPFEPATSVGGVTHDGRHVWAAIGAKLVAFDPASGESGRAFDPPADAGTPVRCSTCISRL